MNPPLRLQFSSRRRISRSSDFARLKEEGRREICGTLILNWLPSKELRLGVVTSRKVGSAVIRSRARRLLREVFRQHHGDRFGHLILVLPEDLTQETASPRPNDRRTHLSTGDNP